MGTTLGSCRCENCKTWDKCMALQKGPFVNIRFDSNYPYLSAYLGSSWLVDVQCVSFVVGTSPSRVRMAPQGRPASLAVHEDSARLLGRKGMERSLDCKKKRTSFGDNWFPIQKAMKFLRAAKVVGTRDISVLCPVPRVASACETREINTW